MKVGDKVRVKKGHKYPEWVGITGTMKIMDGSKKLQCCVKFDGTGICPWFSEHEIELVEAQNENQG